MKNIGLEEFFSLSQGGVTVEADGHGVKVVLLADGTYLKFFRRKRLVSSALIQSYATRFARNCSRLQALGIPAPDVIDLFRVRAKARDVVHYRPLAGRTVRSMLADGLSADKVSEMRIGLGRFVGDLHAKGIYFRSLHLGNIVLGGDGRFGLIDIADLSVGFGPLSKAKAIRNLRHLLRYDAEAAWLAATGEFDAGYGESAKHPVTLCAVSGGKGRESG